MVDEPKQPSRDRLDDVEKRLRHANRRDVEGIVAEERRRLLEIVRGVPGADRALAQGDLSIALLREPFQIDTPKGPLKFTVLGEKSARRGANLLTKQPATIAWIDTFAADSVFWDVGANVGCYSLYAALRRDIRVVAFEPAAINHFLLAANCELNGFTHVDCFPLALAANGSVKELTVSQLEPARSFRFSAGSDNRFPSRQPALVMSIDQLVEAFELPCPNYIKIDVPAAAGAIVEGARRTLMRPEVKEIHVEIDADEDSAAVVDSLTTAGFVIAARSERRAIADVTFVKHQ